jgi:hypothetical protein
MAKREKWAGQSADFKDAVSAWLLLALALVVMNVVVTLATAPACISRAHGTASVPTLTQTALHGALLLAGMSEDPACG